MFDKQVLWRLLAAVLCGGIVGLNRELHGKPAGFRTHALVCLGAATATLAVGYSFATGQIADPSAVSRVVQGLLTGMGFIGAGLILRDPTGHVTGLTTAAAIWTCVAMGCAAAMAAWSILFTALVLVLCVLHFGWAIERGTNKLFGQPPPPDNPPSTPPRTSL